MEAEAAGLEEGLLMNFAEMIAGDLAIEGLLMGPLSKGRSEITIEEALEEEAATGIVMIADPIVTVPIADPKGIGDTIEIDMTEAQIAKGLTEMVNDPIVKDPIEMVNDRQDVNVKAGGAARPRRPKGPWRIPSRPWRRPAWLRMRTASLQILKA